MLHWSVFRYQQYAPLCNGSWVMIFWTSHSWKYIHPSEKFVMRKKIPLYLWKNMFSHSKDMLKVSPKSDRVVFRRFLIGRRVALIINLENSKQNQELYEKTHKVSEQFTEHPWCSTGKVIDISTMAFVPPRPPLGPPDKCPCYANSQDALHTGPSEDPNH